MVRQLLRPAESIQPADMVQNHQAILGMPFVRNALSAHGKLSMNMRQAEP